MVAVQHRQQQRSLPSSKQQRCRRYLGARLLLLLIVVVFVSGLAWNIHQRALSSLDFHFQQPQQPRSCANEDDWVFAFVVSCARFDLLNASLHSFEQFNTYPCVSGRIVLEDCAQRDPDGYLRIQAATQHLNWKFETALPKKPMLNQQRSVENIKEAYLRFVQPTTKWIFQSEDDWLFVRSGFIEESLAILRTNNDGSIIDSTGASKRISKVWMQPLYLAKQIEGVPCHGFSHRIADSVLHWAPSSPTERSTAVPFYTHPRHGWTNNPGVSPRSVYEEIIAAPQFAGSPEGDVSRAFLKANWTLANLLYRVVYHLGDKVSWRRGHTQRNWTTTTDEMVGLPPNFKDCVDGFNVSQIHQWHLTDETAPNW